MGDAQETYVDATVRVVPDLSHHLSDLAKARKPSPLKALARYFNDPNLLSLAGGMPHPDYFPFDSISAEVLSHDNYGLETVPKPPAQSPSTFGWLWNLLGVGPAKHEEITIPKYAPGGQDTVQLSNTLQYDTALGIKPLRDFMQSFAQRVYKPYLPTTTTLMHTGNTDGWNRIVLTFCNPGDGLLVEDWTYPIALVASLPFGVKPVPVDMDEQGMRADALEKLLENWEEEHPEMKRPHVMYLVPIGQNPCGTTMRGERKKALYEVCVKYDIIICEDDPYFFLQEGEYLPRELRSPRAAPVNTEDWLDKLAPSLLRFDYEGRVIRLDTFSKTIAPGSRLGFFTCNPLFADRLLRSGEVSTQAPCGFGQSLVTQLVVKQWGFDKYVRWLQGLQAQYTQRRDMMVDALADEFDLAWEKSDPSFLNGARVLVARERQFAIWRDEKYRTSDANTWFSFVPPTAGMFVWIKIHLYNHPTFKTRERTSITEETLEHKLWVDLVQNGVLFAPGWIFSTDEDELYPADPISKGLKKQGLPTGIHSNSDHGPEYCHLRIAFSAAAESDMKEACRILARVLKQFFHP